MGSHKPKAPADDIESWLQDYPTEEDKGGTRRRPKYPPVESPPPDALDRLTDRDQKLLAALVKKYGAKAITEAAAKIVAPARRRGRPRRGEDPRFERMHLADFFDELVEEHREAGSRHPKLAAMRELFEIARPSRTGDPDAFRRFAKTTKRKLPAGRRDLKAALESAAVIEQRQLSGSKKPRKKTRE